MSRVTQQYKASDALVLPVEAQAARTAPIERACVKAADMPLSLKLPEGFIPSYCKNNRPGLTPTYFATPSEACSRVWPSPTVTHCSMGAKGKRRWNRHTPLKQYGSSRRAHAASNSRSERGTLRRSQAYATSSRLPHLGQATRASSTPHVAP